MKKNNEQVKNIWKPLCLMFAALLTFSWVLFGFLYSKGGVNFSTLENSEQEQVGIGGIEPIPTLESGMTLSVAKTVGQDNATVRTITATIKPDSAKNKEVDWSIAWDNAPVNGTQGVTSFVTLDPQSDGSNVATLTCLKAFGTDTIVVTAKTRGGNHSATCLVKFVGHPTELKIDTSGAMTSYDDKIGYDITELAVGKDYAFSLNLDNVFHSVNPEIQPEYSYAVECIGAVSIVHETNVTGSVITETLDNTDFGQDMVLQVMGGSTKTFNFRDYVASVSITNNILNINALCMFENLVVRNYLNANRTAYDKYYCEGAVDDTYRPYVQISVTEKTSGLTEVFRFRPYSLIEDIELSDEIIEF